MFVLDMPYSSRPKCENTTQSLKKSISRNKNRHHSVLLVSISHMFVEVAFRMPCRIKQNSMLVLSCQREAAQQLRMQIWRYKKMKIKKKICGRIPALYEAESLMR